MQVISLVTGNMAPCLARAMNVQQIRLTSKNLQVVTTFHKFTDYRKKYVIFFELCMEGDPIAYLKGR